jgi:hypothetical protein
MAGGFAGKSSQNYSSLSKMYQVDIKTSIRVICDQKLKEKI